MPYVLAFLKYVIYGTSVFFTSELEEGVDVLDILALRFLVSFVFIWLLKITGIFKIRLGVRDIISPKGRRAHVGGLLLAGLFEPVLYMLFETVGISMSTNVTVAVILSLSPIASCISEAVFLKERSTLLQKLFLGVGICGVVYIAVNTCTAGGTDKPLGIVFLLLAVVSGSLFGVFSRRSSPHFAPMEITYISALLGAVVFNLVNVVRHIATRDILHYFDPFLSYANIVGFVFLGIISAVIATCMNNYCYSRMQLSTMAAFSGVSTLVTVLVGAIFRSEPIYYFHYVGLSLIIIRMVGVSAISIAKDRRSAVHGKKSSVFDKKEKAKATNIKK